MSVIGALGSEWIKHRRSATRALVVLAPLVLAAHFPLVALFGDSEVGWRLFLTAVYNWWCVLWIPMGAGILAALAAARETRSGAWRALRARPSSPATLYGAKLAVLALHALLCALVLLAVALLAGTLAFGPPVPWGRLLLGALLPMLAALPMLAVQLWVATALGSAASVALGVVGFLPGVLVAETGSWIYVPWSWPLRVAIPVVGFHANGTPLEAGSPLRGLPVAPVLLLALATFVAAGALGALWFAGREVR
jgi:ABC-2 type transport system permease protein